MVARPQSAQNVSLLLIIFRSVVPFAVLSRTNLADASRRFSPNPRLFKRLQPLLRAQKSQLLCNQVNPASFCKTPGVGVPHFSPRRASPSAAVTCATWRLYPSPAQSLVHTSRH